MGRTVIHRLENVERQEEKKSVSVEIKLKRRLVIKFGLKKMVWNIILGPSRSSYDFFNKKGLSYRSQSKESAITTVGYIRSLRERVTIDILSYQLWMQSKGKSITWFHHPPRGSVDRALDSGSENPGSSRSGARYSTPGGDGRRSVAGTARGPGEAGEWGGPCPVVGARKTLDLNSAGQQELRDRMVEVRAGATSYA